ncbi:MAG: radical SAM protein [Patescibacteria group bacterium]
MQALQPIIKPVSLSCNLGCDYCYYGPPRKEDFRVILGDSVDKFNVMSEETLGALIAAFAGTRRPVNFMWHGGEPLIAGLKFFQRAVEIQRQVFKRRRQSANTVQTNGLLVDENWARFFMENHFHVGTSLDGTAAMHDVFRVDRSGRGSADKVIKAIKLMVEYGIDVNVISTITKANVGHAAEVYVFLRSLGVTKMKFSHLHERERLGDRSEIAATPEEHATFMIALLDAWLEEDNPEVEISDLVSIIQVLSGGKDVDCIFAGVCERFLTIEYDGSVMWCDTIGKPSEIRIFGNVRDGLDSIVVSRGYRKFQDQFQRLHRKTSKQPWYPFITLGCLGDYPEMPFGAKNPQNTYAESWMSIISAVADRLEANNFRIINDPRKISSR